jgi:hypothetical protein
MTIASRLGAGIEPTTAPLPISDDVRFVAAQSQQSYQAVQDIQYKFHEVITSKDGRFDQFIDGSATQQGETGYERVTQHRSDRSAAARAPNSNILAEIDEASFKGPYVCGRWMRPTPAEEYEYDNPELLSERGRNALGTCDAPHLEFAAFGNGRDLLSDIIAAPAFGQPRWRATKLVIANRPIWRLEMFYFIKNAFTSFPSLSLDLDPARAFSVTHMEERMPVAPYKVYRSIDVETTDIDSNHHCYPTHTIEHYYGLDPKSEFTTDTTITDVHLVKTFDPRDFTEQALQMPANQTVVRFAADGTEEILKWSARGLVQPNPTMTNPAVDAALPIGPGDVFVDLGNRPANVEIRYAFTLQNPTDKPLVILRAHPGCGCTKIDPLPTSVAPHASCPIPITIDVGDRVGRNSFLVQVSLQDHAPMQFWLTAYLISRVPEELYFGQQLKGVPATIHVPLVPLGTNEILNVHDAGATPGFFVFNYGNADATHPQPWLDISLAPTIPQGGFDEIADIVFQDSPIRHQLRLTGWVSRDLEATTRQLRFPGRSAAPGSAPQQTLSLYAPYGHSLQFEYADPSISGAVRLLEIRPSKTAAACDLLLELNPTIVAPNQFFTLLVTAKVNGHDCRIPIDCYASSPNPADSYKPSLQ